MFSDYYLQLSYDHHIHKSVKLEQIFQDDTEASEIYPDFVPNEFITKIIMNGIDYELLCDKYVYERCTPNTDIILRKLYGFWKRKFPDGLPTSIMHAMNMHAMIMSFGFDYIYNKYVMEYYKNRVRLIYECEINTDRDVSTCGKKYIINDCPLALRIRDYIDQHCWNQLIVSPIEIDYDRFYLNRYYDKLLYKYGITSEFYPMTDLLKPFDNREDYPDRVPDEFLHLILSDKVRSFSYHVVARCISNTNINIRKLYNLWLHTCTWNTYDKQPFSKDNSLYYMILKMAKRIISKEFTISYIQYLRLLYDYQYGASDTTLKEHKKINKMKKNNNALTRSIREFIVYKNWNYLLEHHALE